MQNGKGDKLRKGVNLINYRDNFDEIDWSKKELEDESQPLKEETPITEQEKLEK